MANWNERKNQKLEMVNSLGYRQNITNPWIPREERIPCEKNFYYVYNPGAEMYAQGRHMVNGCIELEVASTNPAIRAKPYFRAKVVPGFVIYDITNSINLQAALLDARILADDFGLFSGFRADLTNESNPVKALLAATLRKTLPAGYSENHSARTIAEIELVQLQHEMKGKRLNLAKFLARTPTACG